MGSKTGLRMIGVLGGAVLFCGGVAGGQTTGVSHPEAVPASQGTPLSAEAVSAPTGYVPTPVAETGGLKPRPGVLAESAGATSPIERRVAARGLPAGVDPDTMVVGDATAVRDETRADADAGIVTRPEGGSNSLPPGTVVRARMLEGLSTKETPTGKAFTAELTEPVLREGRVLLPAGSVLTGRVTEVHGGRRITGGAAIHLEAASVTLPDGTRYAVRAQVIEAGLNGANKVDGEGTIVRREHKAQTAAVLGLTTGSGAVAGAMLAGPAGALVGAGIGAGVSTVVWLKQDRQAALPAGTEVMFSLMAPVVVGME